VPTGYQNNWVPRLNIRCWTRRRFRKLLALVIGLGLAITLIASPAASKLPPLQSHPLPPSLVHWNDPKQSGDYFDQIKQVVVGYLVWSQFPVTVYVQPVMPNDSSSPFASKRAKDWINAVLEAVQEWNEYLPLEVVDKPDGADIAVLRSPPPIQLETPPVEQTGSMQERRPTFSLGRARSAETRFEFYAKQPPANSNSNRKAQQDSQESRPLAPLPPLLAQRFTILLRPDQAPSYLRAAARHELGHALGIWGHSPIKTDVMYFSQVRNSPPISPRDINTLKRVYQQPTRVGWHFQNKEGGNGR